MHLITLLYIVTASLNVCQAASLNEESYEIMYKAIKSGSVEILQSVLNDYSRDINEKPFFFVDGNTETKMSPLEMAIACHNPKKIQVILEAKKPVIDISTFEIIFKSSCVDCFDILLDHSADLLDWDFNRDLLDRIEKYSVDNDHFFLFVFKLSKRLDFSNKLSLIENAFSKCTDHDQIAFAVDAVELDIISCSTDMTMLKRDQSAIAFFSRYMVAKMGFDDLLPWATSQFEKYPPVEGCMDRFDEYVSLVQDIDNKEIIVAQPEDYLIRYRNILFKQLENMITGEENDLVGPRVLLKLITGDPENLREDVRKRLPEYLRQRNNAFKQSLIHNSVECLNLLLEFMDLGSINFREALELSIENNSADCMRILIETGLGAEYTIYSRCYHAVMHKAADCLRVLFETNLPVPEQEKLLINAVKLKATECVRVILELGINTNANNTALRLATRSDDFSCVMLLLVYGANPNIPDDYGIMPLAYAVERKYFEITEELLKYGANPNILNTHDQTLLSFSIEIGSAKFLRILLEHGANPNVVDIYGLTPLIEAIERDEKECVKALLGLRADPNLKDRSRKTPLMAAVSKDSVEYLNLLIRNGANIHATTENGDTLSKYAKLESKTRCLEILLEKGVDIDRKAK